MCVCVCVCVCVCRPLVTLKSLQIVDIIHKVHAYVFKLNVYLCHTLGPAEEGVIVTKI